MVWESFRDISYYDMFAVRKITERAFNQAIHVHTEEEADFLVMSLNELEKLKSHNNEYVAQAKSCRNCFFESRCIDTEKVCRQWKSAYATA